MLNGGPEEGSHLRRVGRAAGIVGVGVGVHVHVGAVHVRILVVVHVSILRSKARRHLMAWEGRHLR